MEKFPKDHPFWPNYYSIIGTYFESLGKISEAKEYYNNSILTPPVPIFLKRINFRSYIRLAEIAKSETKLNLAIDYIDSAKNYINPLDTLRSQYYLNNYVSEYYYLAGDFENAYERLKDSKQQGDKLLYENNAIEISKLNVKYQTVEKEKELLLEQEENKRNRNIAYGLGGGVVAVSLIGFLLFTNSRRKQRIAEQQSEIEIQKTEKVLKEQELTTIDAMISGQEKERQRLASDLHDSVGATLAAAKLQFDHLSKNRDKPKEMEPLYDKTAQLLEDAYTEVRSLAHAKNSGVIAKNGLLPAVQQLARNASGTSTLTIEVEDFGLDERIENGLEISIFRMIQELVTNMIKHAEATSASISITQHEESLNIIIEDNGKGFDPKKVITKDGMGLSSIERRIEHLEGSFEVDSTIGKGTTIIIDIPL
jgi:signal transduction histidine kinase